MRGVAVEIGPDEFQAILNKRKLHLVLQGGGPFRVGQDLNIYELHAGRRTGRVVVSWVSYLDQLAGLTVVSVSDTDNPYAYGEGG
jgi:hypothetical protein